MTNQLAHLRVLFVASCFWFAVCIPANASREQAGLAAKWNATRLRRAPVDYDDLDTDAWDHYENSKRFISKDGQWVETANRRGQLNRNYSQRVFGGHIATDSQFPWVANIKLSKPGFFSATLCTGIIVSERLILTAAHCILHW